MSLETDHIIRRFSDEEIVHWREKFGEWPPVRVTDEHMRQLKLKLTRARQRKHERNAVLLSGQRRDVA